MSGGPNGRERPPLSGTKAIKGSMRTVNPETGDSQDTIPETETGLKDPSSFCSTAPQ